MSAYRHLLIAVDLGPEGDAVAARGTDLARRYGARTSLIHVVEFMHMDLANELVLPQDVELEQQMMEKARQRLAARARHLGDPDMPCWVELGSTKHEILRVAAEQDVDLIVVGRHGRHGIQRLLGSTASGVLHGAPCDVLAVHIPEDG